MGFREDAFSLNFNDLYDHHPNRRLNLFRYKVKNYNNTLRKIIVHPQRNVLFLLEDEQKVQCVMDTYNGSKVPVTIASNQAPGASEGENNETIVILTSDLIPKDYRKEMYVYTFESIAKKQMSLQDLYIDTLGTTTFPDLQELFFKNSKDEHKKVSNALTLGKLSLKTATSNYKAYSYHDEDIDYFDGNAIIKLKTPGILGEFGSSYIDDSNHIRQAEYELVEDATHKYALIQAVPTRLKPELVLSSDTYDENKNLRFEIARFFIGSQTRVETIWSEYGFRTKASTSRLDKEVAKAAEDLYLAFLTAVKLSNERLTEFKTYRIADNKSPNFGKIDIGSLKLYGVAVDDILSIDQKEFTGRIFKFWEQEHSGVLEDETNKLQALYQSVKGLLAGLTEYIPSPYSFGNYEKIGRLALEWYFIPASMKLDAINPDVRFTVKLASEKYVFNETTKQITGITEAYRKVSSVRNFNLGSQVTLPSIPAKFTEESKVSTAGSVDTNNISFLNYTWMFQIKDQSKYANLFQTDNPFIITGTTSVSYERPFNNVKILNLNKAGTYTEATAPGLEGYVKNHYSNINREVVAGSAQVVVTVEERYYTSGIPFTGQTDEVPNSGNNRRYYIYKYQFSWSETQLPAINAKPIKPPFSIDQSQWESFESALGSNVSEFVLKPIYLEKLNGIRKLSDIYWKSTLGNYATIELMAVKKDKTTEKVVLEFEQGFKRDQSLVQEGVYV